MDDLLAQQARRLLDRYLVEVVESFDLCPWAAAARRRGEIRIEIVDDDAAEALVRISQDPSVVIGMVVFAASTMSPSELRERRDVLLPRHTDAALADFHPHAALDPSSPAKLVPYLRRSPDPMLQVVPHRVLAAVKRSAPSASRVTQAAMLAGLAPLPALDISEQVARSNAATMRRQGEAIAAVLDDIADDREATYARLGIRVARAAR